MCQEVKGVAHTGPCGDWGVQRSLEQTMMGTGTEVQGGKGQGEHKAQGSSRPQQPKELRWKGSSGGGHDVVTLGWVEGELFIAAQGEEGDRQGCVAPPPVGG